MAEKCKQCGRMYPYKEMTMICCIDRGGCGKDQTPNYDKDL